MTGGVIGQIESSGTGAGTHLITSTFYGTCATGASTAAKIVKLADANIDSATLITGMTLAVKFTNSNSKASPTLTIQTNGGTQLIAAKSIKRYGTTAPSTTAATSWRAGAMVMFVYDGTYWVECSSIDDDTKYTNNITGTGTTGALAQFSGTNTLTTGPAIGTSTTTFLRNDGTWAAVGVSSTEYRSTATSSNASLAAFSKTYTVSGEGLVIVSFSVMTDQTDDWGSCEAVIYKGSTVYADMYTRYFQSSTWPLGTSSTAVIKVSNGDTIKCEGGATRDGTKTAYYDLVAIGCTLS